ncbi:circularly permuted type 2 ATP-grasp protein [Pseudooceanicola sp. C21-150M6]|uniref:circularly permuted type 2 ATP-grasp protein n=1 Tax=Pseudooceanicola sp. C21-150M6 TaxID=3434355 RepID=UPI003D7F9653
MEKAKPVPHRFPLLDGYRPPDGVADELLRADGSLREVWEPLIRHLSEMKRGEIDQSFARGDQYLHDAGVYFRHYTAEGSTPRDWPLSHVPVVIAQEEWDQLAEGLIQRADLLERVMADLYGSGALVSGGLLPAQLVARNPEWLRPLVGIHPRSGHFLHVLAFEVGRSPDGSWLVLGDRTQAPSGNGFALENRMATSRVFPDVFAEANVERLAGFYREFREALNALRPEGEGRVAILTPGQHTSTYFEHAYIARYLGYLLLECEDLRVVKGRLMVRTINGLEPVSVLWRRLDSRFADPLELDENSALGTPGMVEAIRAGTVTMMNALGSGVLEARALMAFLPRISRTLLGEELKLPNIATWWCGQGSEMAYVRDNLERMMIGPAMSTQLPFELDSATALGGRFRDAAERPVMDWLQENGADLVGQEAVTLSTTPAMIKGKLVPRPMVIRAFAVRTPQGWTVMPGGYARIGRTEDPTALAMQNGGSVADVWVASPRPVAYETISGQTDSAFLRRRPGRLPARAADNLFWLGRNIERAQSTVRTLRAYHLRKDESGNRPLPVLDHLRGHLKPRGIDMKTAVPTGLLQMFELAQGCAGKVRDRFSDDGLHALDDLARTARHYSTLEMDGDETSAVMSLLLQKLAGFSGLVSDNMFRSSGWRFMTMGRALERGIQISQLLADFADPDAPSGSFDVAIEIGDSVMSHRRRYNVETNRNTVIDLLALDPENPRSVISQAAILMAQQEELPRESLSTQMRPAARRILRLHTQLAIAAPEDMQTKALYGLSQQLMRISDDLSAQYMG